MRFFSEGNNVTLKQDIKRRKCQSILMKEEKRVEREREGALFG